jgi:hypothetical protein
MGSRLFLYEIEKKKMIKKVSLIFSEILNLHSFMAIRNLLQDFQWDCKLLLNNFVDNNWWNWQRATFFQIFKNKYLYILSLQRLLTELKKRKKKEKKSC